MSAIIVNSNIMCNTFQLGFTVDAELTSVHFPVNKREIHMKMLLNLIISEEKDDFFLKQ